MIPAYRYRAKLLRVLDGDTFEMDVDAGFYVHAHVKIRLRGYSAPELNEPGGLEAKMIAMELLTLAPSIVVETFGRSFERWVGDIFLGNESLGALLLARGVVTAGA